MTDLRTRLALEDDAFATTADSTTAAVQVRVLVSRAVDVVVFILIFGVVRTGDSGRGSCCGATAVEWGDERRRLSSEDDEQKQQPGIERSRETTSRSSGKFEYRQVVVGCFRGEAARMRREDGNI